MSAYRDQVLAAMRVTKIVSPTRCSWFGQASPPLPRRTLRALDAGAKRAHLLSQLKQSLYSGFYKAGSPTRDAIAPVRPARSPSLIEALSRANTGAGCWSPGWVVRSVDADGVVGERDQLRLKAPAGSWRAPVGTEARVGATVDLLTPKEQLGISPGFYLAQGNTELELGDAARIVRVYWNTTPKGAVLLMGTLTHLLNDWGVAFRFKVVGHVDCYARCDAAVLYVQKDDFDRVAPAVARAFVSAARELDVRVPAFTKRLAPGVALAEDPGESTSFGWHRCGLVAGAVVDAHERGMGSLDRRLERVEEHFAAAGVSLDAPYLNLGSVDRYGVVA